MKVPFLTDPNVQDDNRKRNNTAKLRRACSILMELGEKAAQEKTHGEVSVTVYLQDGVIQGFRDSCSRSNK